MSPRVCLVTTGHPSTNPRLVKEADALAEAGYDVRVVAAKFVRWADAADARFADRPWRVSWVRFGEMASRPARILRSLRQRLGRAAVSRLGDRRPLLRWAIHYVTPDLAREASREPADLYVAHNLGALPAAAVAAARHGARLGFDAEDFHSGQIADEEGAEWLLTRTVERIYIPCCDYVTAASDGIADAYAGTLGIERPTTVLNVFPLADRDVPLPEAERAAEVPVGRRSLYWFSQTIGPERGLEDAVRALPHLPDDVVLSLRGQWAAGYEAALRAEADRLGVSGRLRALPVTPPDEMVARAALHDVGLALELGQTVNRDICVTNKLFTYLVAGIPAVATATTGQRGIAAQVPEAVRLYPVGDVSAFAEAARALLDDPESAQRAETAGRTRYHWDAEKETFLRLVAGALGTEAPGPPEAVPA